MNILVIGGGHGGYVAAIRAAQQGGSVTLIEKNSVGGTCLNRGCMPTKALLHSAELYTQARSSAGCGVVCGDVSLDWAKVQENRAAVVSRLTNGVRGLMRANRVKVISGEAKFTGPKTVEVDGQTLQADKIIIAAGGIPVTPPIPGIESVSACIDSTACLELDHVPESLLIVGGGVIGVELGYAYSCFGSKVTILEKLPGILPGTDAELAAMLAAQLKQTGIELVTDCQVLSVKEDGDGVEAIADCAGTERSFHAEKLLVCVGRKPDIAALQLDKAGIETADGHIVTDEYLETNVAGVYAVGDCTGKLMLAHAAMTMGEIAAENIFDAGREFCPDMIPVCCYVGPEFAGVGLTEEAAKEQGYEYKVGRFPTAANGRSLVSGSTDGMVKIIVGADYGELLGVHILAPNATELIHQAELAMRLELGAPDFIDNVTCHPTVSEAVREAFMAANGRAIHNVN